MTKKEVLTKAQKKVEKMNAFVLKCIEENCGETDLYLDNTSTIIGAPEAIEPNYRIQDGRLYKGEEYLCRVIEYDEEEKTYFEDFEFQDFLNFEKACIRRGAKYWQKYTEKCEESEAALERFYYSL